MKLFALAYLACVISSGQSRPTTGTAETKGSCSPAVTGDSNTFTITCGIGKEQGIRMLEILNKILANQIDPGLVMAKLEEIHNDVKHIRDNQGWPHLTDDQMRSITNAVASFPGQKMQIEVPNPEPDTSALAAQIAQALRAAPANWNGSVQTMMTFAPPDAPIPLGIEFRVKDDSPALEALGKALIAIFGQGAVHGVKDPKAPEDRIDIWILWKPR